MLVLIGNDKKEIFIKKYLSIDPMNAKYRPEYSRKTDYLMANGVMQEEGFYSDEIASSYSKFLMQFAKDDKKIKPFSSFVLEKAKVRKIWELAPDPQFQSDTLDRIADEVKKPEYSVSYVDRTVKMALGKGISEEKNYEPSINKMIKELHFSYLITKRDAFDSIKYVNMFNTPYQIFEDALTNLFRSIHKLGENLDATLLEELAKSSLEEH